ncbi:splicing regulator SDE2 [Maniola hyperantus]|uniref:splicing regulator SDE2 n=1 Tax=Aphantopus hyperantus TaxID=2795564 RepID=UPI001568C33B|nr:replication stress response regulator SDE2 [Maniola hyperantus]
MENMIYFENCLLFNATSYTDVFELKRNISAQYGIPVEDLYVTLNGKLAYDDCNLGNSDNVVRVRSKIVGGKGGFGSMLRAIGAQIEKTTNREACRDLSGRRLRDINEEKRLRKWLEGQEDREQEAAERKKKKLERLIAEPKIDVNLHPQYEKERQELPERVSAAVDAGWQAAGTSNEGVKRKAEVEQSKAKKKAKLWIDADLSDCSSLSDDEEVEIKSNTAQTVSTDSGNESDKCSGSSKI